MSSEPYHAHLYVSIRRNSPKPMSEMARANARFCTMPRTCRSSMTIARLVFASSVVTLCKKSCRMLRIFRCRRASANADFRRFREPGFFRLCRFDNRSKRRRYRRNGFGALIFVPSDNVRNHETPKSTPTGSPEGGTGSGISVSVAKLTYHRSASRFTVADKIRPSTYGFSFSRIRPSRGSCTALSKTRIEPVRRNESSRPFFLNRGNPTLRPSFNPRKKC